MKNNKDVKLIFSQMGVSMVQVMIAFGLVGGLALVMTKISQQGIRTSKSLESRTALKDWLNEISSRYITDGAACTNNFSAAGPNTIRRTDIVNAIPNLYDGDGAVFVSLNDLILKDVYQITAMNLQPQDNTTGASEGICTLDIELTVQNNQVMGAQIQNHSIDFYCSVDATVEALPDDWHPITNCYPSTTTTYNSLWNLTMIAGREYINWTPSSGLGAAVIGPMSADPTNDDTGSLNVNMDGIAFGGVGLREGIAFNYNSTFSFGDWHLVGEDITTEQYLALRFWDGEEFHHGMVIHDNYLEFPALQDDAGTTANYQGNSIHVRGDIYAWQNVPQLPTSFIGMGHLPYDQVLALGMGPAMTHGANRNFYYPNVTSAAWGMRQPGYPGDKGAGEHFFVMRPDGESAKVVLDENAHLESGFRMRWPANMIISEDMEWVFNLNNKNNWFMGPGHLIRTPSPKMTRYSMILGENHDTNSQYTLMAGRNITQNIGLFQYGFYMADNLSLLNRVSTGFVVGKIDQISGTNSFFTNGSWVFATGESSDTLGSMTFNTGFGNIGYDDENFSTNLGYSTTYTLGQHSVGDYPRFSIGQQLSLLSGGGFNLQTGFDKFGANLPSTPSRLFLAGARSFAQGTTGDYALIGHNYYRMCDNDPLTTCAFYRSPGATTSFGSAFLYFGDTEIFFGSVPNTGSSNEARNEVSDNIATAGLVSFTSTGISIPGNLDGFNMYTQDLSCGSTALPSDQKLKQDIVDLDQESLERFWKLNPVEYEKKKYPGEKRFGFIAQEVEKLFPNLVVKNPVNGFLSLNYEGFYALMVSAFQYLLSLFDDARKELQKLIAIFDQMFGQTHELKSINQQRLEYLERINEK